MKGAHTALVQALPACLVLHTADVHSDGPLFKLFLEPLSNQRQA
jgi:hypothetical protein